MAPNRPSATNSPANSLYQRTIYVLDHSIDRDRLKKVLLCACRNTWESDPDRLEAISWETLLTEAQNQFPHLGAVEAAFHEVVQALSKPETYEPIAQELLQILTSLYEEGVTSPPRSAPTPQAQEATQFAGLGSTNRSRRSLVERISRSRSASRDDMPSAPLSRPHLNTSGLSTGISTSFNVVSNLIPQRTWRKYLRKRYILLVLGSITLVVATHDFLTHFNPFRPQDICFLEIPLPDRGANYRTYTPVRCSNTDQILGPSVGAPHGQIRFRDVDQDGQVDYVVSPETLACRLRLQPCPRGESTAVSVDFDQGYNPTFEIISDP
ncbi:MAG: hypothetical protein ACO4CG_06955 [Prochlorothrix sp.]